MVVGDISIDDAGAVTLRSNDEGSLGRIDQYVLVRELGGGGFGTVYLARDTVSGVEYAVKGLPPMVRNSDEEMENVRANFALVSRLSHTNIARAHVLHLAKEVVYSDPSAHAKLCVDPGDTLMMMEYAPGVTLSKWRKQFPDGKVPLAQALEIVRPVASALDYAHGKRILHRDIKPANVMVETRPDGRLVARVLDFGFASEIRSSMGHVSREIHDTSGTRPYMAPEQWVGDKQGPATDQYALAVLFHELVTGSVPFASLFDTGDPVQTMKVVTTRAPEISADLPEPVRLALARALAKKPEERFPSCAAFVDALGGAQLVAPASHANTGGAQLVAPVTSGARSCATAGILIAALLALAALGGWWLFGEKGMRRVAVAPIVVTNEIVRVVTNEVEKPVVHVVTNEVEKPVVHVVTNEVEKPVVQVATNEVVKPQRGALVHRWSFSGDLKDSVGGRDGRIVDGKVSFENGQVRIRPGGGYVDLGANVLPGGGVAEYTFEIWATKHSIQNWARVYQIPDSWHRNDFYWAWNNGTERRKWKWKVPGYGNWTKTIGNGTGEGIEDHFVFVYGHDAEKKPRFWVYILRGGNVYWWRSERLKGTMFKSHSAFWLGHGDGARADASYNEVRIWNRALTRDEIIRSGKLGPDRLP